MEAAIRTAAKPSMSRVSFAWDASQVAKARGDLVPKRAYVLRERDCAPVVHPLDQIDNAVLLEVAGVTASESVLDAEEALLRVSFGEVLGL